MALSALQLASGALVLLGATPIASFEEGSAEAIAAGHLYAPVRDFLLSSYPWRFATTTVRLQRLDVDPAQDYRFAYQLPDRFLRALSVGEAGSVRGLTFRIAGRRLLTDAPMPALTFVFRPAEADCPSFFDTALLHRLAAELCLPITESAARAEHLARLAEASFRQARAIDAQQDSVRAIEHFPLIEVRR